VAVVVVLTQTQQVLTVDLVVEVLTLDLKELVPQTKVTMEQIQVALT
jgi:hypothetical protein